MAAVVFLGLDWLYWVLEARYRCPVMNVSPQCGELILYGVYFGIFGLPLLIAAIVILISAAILLVCFLRDRRLMKAQEISLVSDGEADAILEVAQDAAKRLRWPEVGKDLSTNALLPTILSLKRRQNLNYGKYSFIGKLINYCSPRSISRDDLIILAPYIDDWLSGNTIGLPAEYNPDNNVLPAFKKRLLCSGDWPDERAMEEVKPRSA
jgi:hypothetical protein